MIKKNTKRLKILIGLIILSHCSFGQFSPNIEKDRQLNYFPNSIGNYWSYKVVDNVKNTIDTLTVEIVQDTVIYGKSYMIWEYRYTDKIEKLYYSTSNDSIEVIRAWDHQYNFMYDIIQLYLIPFEFEFQQNWEIPSK